MGFSTMSSRLAASRSIRGRLLGCAIVAAVTIVPVEACAAQHEQVALTGRVVERYVLSRLALEKLLKSLETRLGPAPIAEGEDEVLALAGYLDRPTAKAEVDAVLKRHGFASLDQWANVSYTVLLAAGTLLSPASTGSIGEEKAKASAEIGRDATLSDEQRRRAIADLDEQFAALAAYAPRPANLDAVRPYLDQIRPLIGGDQ